MVPFETQLAQNQQNGSDASTKSTRGPADCNCVESNGRAQAFSCMNHLRCSPETFGGSCTPSERSSSMRTPCACVASGCATRGPEHCLLLPCLPRCVVAFSVFGVATSCVIVCCLLCLPIVKCCVLWLRLVSFFACHAVVCNYDCGLSGVTFSVRLLVC